MQHTQFIRLTGVGGSHVSIRRQQIESISESAEVNATRIVTLTGTTFHVRESHDDICITLFGSDRDDEDMD